MKHKALIFRIVATVFLGIAFAAISLLIVAMTPIYLALSMKGHTKFASLVPMIPLGIIGTAIYGLWRDSDDMTEEEEAYYEGLRKGKIKAYTEQGMIDGQKMLAKPEDLTIKPIYALSKSAKWKQEDIKGINPPTLYPLGTTDDIPY